MTGSRSASIPADGDAQPGPAHGPPDRHRFYGAATVALTVLVVLMVLVLVGRPLSTDDLWFHLKMGSEYLHGGLWPTQDPMLHTSGGVAPVQHEWLFGVLVYGVRSLVGDHGLRAFHVLWVLLLVVLAYRLLRAAEVPRAHAAAAVACWLGLSMVRLIQLRPDLVTIGCVLLLGPVLLVRTPSKAGAAALLGLFVAWANAHSLFAIGGALLCAAAVGELTANALARRIGAPARQEGVARTLLVLAGLAVLFAGLNPRGFAQHATFFSSSSSHAIWEIEDEWHAFNPFVFGPPQNSRAVTLLAFVVANLCLALFLVAAARRLVAFRSRPSAETLASLDARGLLVAAAGLCAGLISIRFLWMDVFVMAYVLRGRDAMPPRPVSTLVATLASACTLVALPGQGGWSLYMSDVPDDPATYLRQPFNEIKYIESGVAFLDEAGLEGKLYNPYPMGGRLGLRLAPRLRTFIDGRTEHYPAQVFYDHQAIAVRGENADGRTWLELLDDYDVNVVVGVGGPLFHYALTSTLHLLDRVPGWALVYRAVDQAIWVRKDGANVENLERVRAYYARRGVAFDPARGLDLHALMVSHPEYARAQRLVPAAWPDLLEDARTAAPGSDTQLAALRAMRAVYMAAGDAVGADEMARALSNAR